MPWGRADPAAVRAWVLAVRDALLPPLAVGSAALAGASLLGHCPPRLPAAVRLPEASWRRSRNGCRPSREFFRGLLFGATAKALSPCDTLILLTALLFALGHYLSHLRSGRAGCVFPGLLFGLLRQGTGSVLAGTLFHATCNLFMETAPTQPGLKCGEQSASRCCGCWIYSGHTASPTSSHADRLRLRCKH